MADLKPCGTPAAYRRHRRKGEPACAACLAALSAYTLSRYHQTKTLTGHQTKATGWTATPARIAGAAQARAAYGEQAADRWEEFAFLRDGGEDWRWLADRLGISLTTARRYQYLWYRRRMGLTVKQAASRLDLSLDTARAYDGSLTAVAA